MAMFKPHTVERIEIDYPPGSGDIVGVVKLKKLVGTKDYTGIDGYFGTENVYWREVFGGSDGAHQKRIERSIDSATKVIRNSAALALKTEIEV